jgi:hypothetical protein
VPQASDPRWAYIDRSALEGSNMSDIMLAWFAMFHDDLKLAALRKAQNKFVCGRAYQCRMLQNDDLFYVMIKVDASQRKESRVVCITFKQSVGHNERTPLQPLSARCSPAAKGQKACTAGDNCPCCSHIITAFVALQQLQLGTITAGDIGDGARAWGGVNQSSHVSVQSMRTISLLVQGGAKLRGFTGFRPGAPPLAPQMRLFLERINKLRHESDDPDQNLVPRLIVDVHHDTQPHVAPIV